MDEPNTLKTKASPLIIKICKNKDECKPEIDHSKQIQTSTSIKPFILDLNSLTVGNKKLCLKLPSSLSNKIKIKVNEQKDLSSSCESSSKKRALEPDGISIEQCPRQSLITQLSTFSDKKLDIVLDGDESNLPKWEKPPLVMQSSNLSTDCTLDDMHYRGGNETSLLSLSSCSGVPSTSKATRSSNGKLIVLPMQKKIKQSDKTTAQPHKLSVLPGNFKIVNSPEKLNIKLVKSPFLNSKQVGCLRQSLISQLSKLPVKSLDIGQVGDTSKVSEEEKPSASSVSSDCKLGTVHKSNTNIAFDVTTSNISTIPPKFKISSQDISLDCEEPAKKKIKLVEDGQEQIFDEFHFQSQADLISSGICKSKEDMDCTVNQLITGTSPVSQMSELYTREMVDFAMNEGIDQVFESDQTSISESLEEEEESKLLEKSNNLEKFPNEKSLIDNVSINLKESDLSTYELLSDTKLHTSEVKVEYCKQPTSDRVNEGIPSNIDSNQADSGNREIVDFAMNEGIDQVFEPDQTSISESLEEEETKLLEKSKNLEKFPNEKSLIDNVSINLQESDLSTYELLSDTKLCTSEVKLEYCKQPTSDRVNEGIPSNIDSNQANSQNGEEPEMEFKILNEFERNENERDENNKQSGDESDISTDEIDAMLEEGLDKYGKQSEANSNLQHEVKQKVILKVRGRDHFEVLPEGWIEVTHNSGMPVYLHKQTRVCSVSKPYFLGPGSTRKHEIPISAIPCLHYLKQIEKEREMENGVLETETPSENKVSTENNDTQVSNGMFEDKTGVSKNYAAEGVKENVSDISKDKDNQNPEKNNGVSEVTPDKENQQPDKTAAVDTNKAANLILPSAKLESVKDNKVTGSLDYLTVREYCQKRFEFQTINVKRFKTWLGRRKHQKLLKRKQRPFLPDSTQLITCPLPTNNNKTINPGTTSKREFIMNPTGKSPICILHEYVQHTLRLQPKYIFKELESASTPYGAVVIINDMEYGWGYGSSKKVAKSEAAKIALEILIPKMKTFAPEKHSGDEDELQDVEYFDQIKVEDPRVCELSVKAGHPYPYQILLECLKRNYGMGDTEVNIEIKNLKHQKNEFIMKVGKHSATVVCKNKRDGKHRASQSILQQLHPHISSWGSLLRMYGKGSCKTLKEKKEEEQRITELQTKACVNKPNHSILKKLKEEMLKYREKMKSRKPIGKLIPENMQSLSTFGSNLKSIEL